MQVFTSDISGKTFPITQRISGHAVRQCIADEITKDYPDFNSQNFLSIEELNHYRNQYIQNALTKELGTLTDLEKQVIQTLQNDQLITDKLEDKHDKLTYGQKLADKVAS